MHLSLKTVVSLLLVFGIYSGANIFMKLSALQNEFSLSVFFLICTFCVLALYAVLWQKVLKIIPLSTAYIFKSVTIVYGILFGSALFGESISNNNILGAFLIVLGIIYRGWK